VEAQAGQVETTVAAPCPLRGFTRATVVASSSDAGRLAAAGALLSAGAGLVDKLEDGDLPRPAQPPARRVVDRLTRSGTALAAAVGLDPRPVLDAPRAAAAAERACSPELGALLQPTGNAVAALFAHTAVVADRPENAAALSACGQAFGRLVHLLDAVQDHDADRAAGRFNPLEATGTDEDGARALADALVRQVQQSLAEAELQDRALVDVLLGRELVKAVHRVLPPPACSSAAIPAQRSATGTLAAWALLLNAVFIGGSFGGSGCGPRGGRRYRGYPPGYGAGPGYGSPRGYGRRPGYGGGFQTVGPSCGQMLACNCCANLACNACCCGNECA